MKKGFKAVSAILSMLLVILFCFFSCGGSADSCTTGTEKDRQKTIEIGDMLATNQPTPTDIEFSATRYLLIKRAYILNGLKEKADSLPCPIDLPIGYLYLYLDGIGLVDIILIEGAPVSLSTYLSADSEYYERYNTSNRWLPDVDGTYGENEKGIFFFLVDGSFREWSGQYYYSDTLLDLNEPTIKIQGVDTEW